MYVKNSKGAQAHLHALAYLSEGGHNQLFAMLFRGPSTAAKAIKATCHAGNNLSTKGAGYVDGRRFKFDKDSGVVAESERILEGTQSITLAVMEPRPNGDAIVIGEFFEGDRHDQLYRALDLYTPYCVLPEWRHILWTAGLEAHLIRILLTKGWEWAAAVDVNGWDEVIDQLAKRGELMHIR